MMAVMPPWSDHVFVIHPCRSLKQRCNLRCQGEGLCLEPSLVCIDRLSLKSLFDRRGGAEEVFHGHIGNLEQAVTMHLQRLKISPPLVLIDVKKRRDVLKVEF